MKKMIVTKWLGMAAIACTLCFVSCKPAQQQTEVAPIDDRAEILFETTMGNFKMALFNETPLHRDVYLVLAKVGYYDSLLFHRVIDNFVLQAGDPNSRYAKAGELLGDGEPFKIPAEIHFPKLYHKRGMVNAARQGDDTNPDRLSCGSQFAIMTCGPLTDAQIERGQQRMWAGTDSTATLTEEMIKTYKEVGGSPHLDAQYTVFAEIVEGMDVVDKIQKVATDKFDRPIEDVRIIKATVVKDYKK